VTSTVLVDYKDPVGSLKILLDYTLVAIDFPHNEFLECEEESERRMSCACSLSEGPSC